MRKDSLILVSTNSKTISGWETLLEDDFDLEVASSGQSALAFLRQKIPSAIVMDHSLEDFLTFVFIDKIRNNPATRNLPIILVSRESSNSFVEQGVRSGVSHYIGVPFESEVFVEKIKMALKPGSAISLKRFFKLSAQYEVPVSSFARISYISSTGIHFETHIKAEPGATINFSSPLTKELGVDTLEVKVDRVGQDVYYNYPYCIDASWPNNAVRQQMQSWIAGHKDLNSPKKAKILIITSDRNVEAELSTLINQSEYSLRVQYDLETGLQNLPFLNPACIIVAQKSFDEALGAFQQRFFNSLKERNLPWIYYSEADDEKTFQVTPFQSPPNVSSLVLAIKKLVPPLQPEPDRIYFSKHLEDSRARIHFRGKTFELSESGLRIGLEHELIPPCNLQVGLTIFTDQDFRNPYIRLWPPTERLSGQNLTKTCYESHFLGINDQKGQLIRQWLINEELKETRKKIADVKPKE